MLVFGHHVAENGEQAASMALKAGVDMEMSGEMFRKHLLSAVHDLLIDENVIDNAVRRILRMKFQLGLFERPFADPEQAERRIGCREHIELARQVASESIILLKNDAV